MRIVDYPIGDTRWLDYVADVGTISPLKYTNYISQPGVTGRINDTKIEELEREVFTLRCLVEELLAKQETCNTEELI